jgi:hypothetical protein
LFFLNTSLAQGILAATNINQMPKETSPSQLPLPKAIKQKASQARRSRKRRVTLIT